MTAANEGEIPVEALNTFERVTAQLRAWGIDFGVIEHPKVRTCEEMARHCACPERQILKCAVLTDTNGADWLYVLPGDKKIRANPLRRWLGLKGMSFATAERVQARCGCEPGAVPPLGHPRPLATILDHEVFAQETGFISPGRHDFSLRVPTAMLRRIAGARIWDGEPGQ